MSSTKTTKAMRQPETNGQDEAPSGRRLAGNLGPGILYPGVGELVQRTGKAYRCGTIAALVMGYAEHENSMDKSRTSTRFAGRFLLTDHAGKAMQGLECYFPGTVTRALRTALDRNPTGEPVQVAFEVWCEPDAPGAKRSPLRYSYACYDLSKQKADDPLLMLAASAGIIELPAEPQRALPGADIIPDDIDPETGEVYTRAAA